MSFHFFSCEEKSQTGFSFIFWDVIIPVIVPHQGLFPRTPFLVPGPGCWRAVRKMWRTHSLDQTSMRMGSRIIRHHLTQVRLLFVVPITEKALSSHLQILFTSGYRKRHPGKNRADCQPIPFSKDACVCNERSANTINRCQLVCPTHCFFFNRNRRSLSGPTSPSVASCVWRPGEPKRNRRDRLLLTQVNRSCLDPSAAWCRACPQRMRSARFS